MNLAAFTDVAFEDQEAWLQFLHIHMLAHEGLDQATEDAGGTLENFPLADFDEQQNWLQRHMQIHRELAEQWLIDPPPDLEYWDLSVEDDFYDWMLLHAQEHTRISLTAGVE